jgi:2-polyprenyl-3-methyl-5-hydroxy-6-metoxy-1,4-benzoquinol methylase
MLEIGCASGCFLHYMATCGWQVEGIEFSSFAAANARRLGYVVHSGALENVENVGGPFDLIVAWMVMEHLHEPVMVLRKLRTWTKPGGRFAFSVPDCSSFVFRIFKGYWHDLHVPAHLYHFTPHTLQRVLRQGGWRINRIIWQRNAYNLLPSIGHALREKCGVLRLAQYLEAPGRLELVLRLWSLLMGRVRQSGRITVWATRAD